jgi:tRNA-Thr(GGU) m(6)t(6)A37 methyltransferase TsaA
MDIIFQPIGVIHSPYKDIVDMPIQPSGAKGVRGCIKIDSKFVDGLKDLQGFSHLFLIYHFHQVTTTQLRVTPFLDTVPRGVFSTRAPKRPNPIGLSVVKLVKIEGGVLDVENVDILDGTPLLDIKPHVPEFDHPSVERIGWLEEVRGQVSDKRSDDRFR